MARANKYTSINFNDIYEKSSNSSTNRSKHPPSSSPSLYSVISSPNGYKNHFSSSGAPGRMLVLTRPSPKSVPSIAAGPLSPSPKTPSAQSQISDNSHESDLISLRPLGRTGSGASPFSSPVALPEREKEIGAVVGSPTTNKFVPPHLRPGFAGREERPGPEVFRGKEQSHRQLHPSQQQQQQQPGFYGEDGRPKSGGYDRRGKGINPGPILVNRPRSSGNRPNSSG